MKHFPVMLAACWFMLVFPSANFAGTITFKEKDGTTTSITNAEIVSISEGRIIIEKDKKKRAFSLSSVSSFYQSDTAETGGSVPGEFSDYKVVIEDVKMPEKGVDKDGGTEVCQINYHITRIENKGKTKRYKIPYLYLYVLTSAASDTEERGIYRYCHPDAAKPKGKGYDQAAVIDKVTGFGRHIWDSEERDLDIGLKDFGVEKIKIELKGIKSKRILAYHIEIWGNDAIAIEKDWKSFDAKVGSRWWERM